jgi:hypothetical protein
MKRDDKLLARIERLLAIPPLIEQLGRQLVALRAERRTQERKIKAREAVIRKELLDLDLYQQCSNADERNAVYQDALHADPNWEALQERLEDILIAIDKATYERDALDHERKALKAALEREYADIISELLSDRMLANAVSQHRGVARA